MKTIQFYFTVFAFAMMCSTASFIWVIIFGLNTYVSYKIWINSSDNERKYYTGAKWLEDNTGIDFWKDC